MKDFIYKLFRWKFGIVTGIFLLVSALFPRTAFADLEITIHPGHYINDVDDAFEDQKEVNDTAGNASLIDDKQWSDQRAATVKDLTDYVPGVIAQPRDGAESSRLSIRGSGLANVFQGRGLLVLENGVPINMADGEFEFPVIEPWLISRAQIFPGADALQYGGSTFGGAINFITPTGASNPGTTFRLEGGSFDTTHEMISTGQQWKNGDLFAALTGFTQDGFREHNNQTTGHLDANWGWQMNDDVVNRLYISHTHTAAEIPGAITLAQVKDDPTQTNPANSAGNYQRNLEITRVADRTSWIEGANRLDTTVFYTYRRLDNPVTTYEFQNNNDGGTLAKFTHGYGDKSRWLAGFNAYYGDADEMRYQNIGGTPGAHILDRQSYALTTEAYGQIEQHLVDNLFAIGAIQLSYDTRDIYQTYPSVAHQNEVYTGYNPRVGLRYDVDQNTQIFTNLSRSFEPPTWSELSGGNVPGFNELRAQTATTAEIGTRGIYKNIHWEAAYYHGWLHDEFVNYEFTDGSTATINANKTKRDGVELGMDGHVAENIFDNKDAIAVRAAYTFSRFTLDHDPIYGNNKLPGVPEHYIRAELLYVFPSGISFGPNLEWSPTPSPADLANTLTTNAYSLLGARLFWEEPDQKWGFYIEGRNLIDTHYVATTNVIPNASGQDGRYFYPGEGRAIYTGFTWRL